jgi:hypothetical protein
MTLQGSVAALLARLYPASFGGIGERLRVVVQLLKLNLQTVSQASRARASYADLASTQRWQFIGTKGQRTLVTQLWKSHIESRSPSLGI